MKLKPKSNVITHRHVYYDNFIELKLNQVLIQLKISLNF